MISLSVTTLLIFHPLRSFLLPFFSLFFQSTLSTQTPSSWLSISSETRLLISFLIFPFGSYPSSSSSFFFFFSFLFPFLSRFAALSKSLLKSTKSVCFIIAFTAASRSSSSSPMSCLNRASSFITFTKVSISRSLSPEHSGEFRNSGFVQASGISNFGLAEATGGRTSGCLEVVSRDSSSLRSSREGDDCTRGRSICSW